MKSRPIRFGALSLLTLMVAVCLATLAVLSYVTAQSSCELADKYAARVKAASLMDVRGQEWLAQVDVVLQQASLQVDPDAAIEDALSDGTVWVPATRTITVDLSDESGQQLHVTLLVDSDYNYTVMSWCKTVAWTQDTSIGGNLLGS